MFQSRLKLSFGVILVCFLFALLPAAAAQENPVDQIPVREQPVAYPGLNRDCERVEQLMNLGETPYSIIKGGGFLRTAEQQNATITASDAGDRWVFATAARAAVRITLASDIDLLMRIYKGLEQVYSTVIPAGPGEEVPFPIDRDNPVYTPGYYTLVVTRRDIADRSVTGSYSVTVHGDLAVGVGLGERVQGVITEQIDRNQWIFYNRFASGQTESELVMNIQTSRPVRLRLLYGKELLQEQNQDVPVGSRLYSFRLDKVGYYVIAVAENADGQIDYSFSLSTVNDIVGRPKRSAEIAPLLQPKWEQVTPQRLRLDPNQLVFTALDTQMIIPPDVAEIVVPSNSTRIAFAQEGVPNNQLSTFTFTNKDLRQVVLADGGLHVTRKDGVYYYIEGYDWKQTFSDTSEFRNVKLPDGRQISRVNFSAVRSVWMLRRCFGLELNNGARFIAEGANVDFGLIPGQGGNIDELIGHLVTVDGELYKNEFNIDWREVRRILTSGGSVTIDLTGQRTLQFDRLNLIISRQGDVFKVSEKVIQTSGSVINDLITTDWDNLLRVLVNGNRLTLDVLDRRGRIERQRRGGSTFNNMVSLQGVIRVLWSDTGQSLLLPESEDFIQIETPPQARVFDKLARPGQPNYLPIGVNNTGQECYPVNTAFEFNCAPNGEGNPVNGNLSLTITDLYTRGYRLDLTLSRTYNSLNAKIDGPFGYGWSTDYVLDYDMYFNAIENTPRVRLVDVLTDYRASLDLFQAPRGQVVYTTASGSRHVFTLTRIENVFSWRSQTLPGWRIDLRQNDLLDAWRVVRNDGLVYEFDRAGRLRKISHPHGGTLTVSSPSGERTRYVISDDVGRRILLQYDADQHVIFAGLYDGDQTLAETDYLYQNGYLVEVRYSDSSIATYQYDDDGVLIFHDDPRAPLASRLFYNYEKTEEFGSRLRWISAFEDGRNPESGRELYRSYRYAVIDDPTDNIPGLLAATSIDDFNRETLWEYDFSDDPLQVYKLRRKTNPIGEQILYSYSDLNTRLITQISQQGVNYIINYDSGTTIKDLVHPQAWIGFGSSYERVQVGGRPILTPTRFRDNTTNGPIGEEYKYDEFGRVVSILNTDGILTRIEQYHPVFGLPTEMTIVYPVPPVPRGQPVPETETDKITLTYDDKGYLQTWTGPEGTYRFTWDGFGLVTGYSMAYGDNVLVSYSILYQRSRAGQLITVTDMLNTQTRYGFDDRQLLREVWVRHGDATLERTGYTYDVFGRLVEERRYITGNEAEDLFTRYKYTTDGVMATGNWRLVKTDPSGVVTVTEYDGLDRTAAEFSAEGLRTTYTYVPLGQRETTRTVIRTEPNGVQTNYVYNLAGQVCGVNYGAVNWQVAYKGQNCTDPQRQLTRILIDQRVTITFNRYDEAGRPLEIAFSIRRPDDTDPKLFTTSDGSNFTMLYDYDTRKRLIKAQNATSGDTAFYSYAFANGVTSVTQLNSRVLIVARREERTDFDQLVYQYDSLGRLVRVSGQDGTVDYTYTPLPEQGFFEVKLVFSGGSERRLYYDSLGRLRQWHDEQGNLTSYEYDWAGRLLHVHVNDTLSAAYTYDKSSNVLTITNENGLTRAFFYNGSGQLVMERGFDGIVKTFAYDPLGNLLSVTDTQGHTTAYRYDQLNRLITITDASGKRQTFDWSADKNGWLGYNDGLNSASYHFDFFNRLWQIQDTGKVQHFFSYTADSAIARFEPFNRGHSLAFQYEPDMRLTGLSGFGNWNWLYDYDGLGRLISRQDPDGGQVTFAYDRLGRLTAVNVPGSNSARTYEYPTQGTITVKLGGAQTTLHYDDLFRLREQVVSGDGAAQTTTYVYDGRGGYHVTDPYGTQTVYRYVPNGAGDPLWTVQQFGMGQELATEQRYGTETRYYVDSRGLLFGIVRDALLDDGGRFSSEERLDYDALGRPIRYIDAEGNIHTYIYDLEGRLVSVMYPDGGIYRYEYDALRRVTRIISPDGQSLNLAYNTLNQMQTVSLNGSLLERYLYSAAGNLLERQFPNYVEGIGRLTYSYSPARRLTGWGLDSAATVTLGRSADGLSRVLSIDGGGITAKYGYDALGRLTTAQNGAFSQTFTHNPLGDLIGIEGSGGSWTYDYSYEPDGSYYTFAMSAETGQSLDVYLDDHLRVLQISANGERIALNYSTREVNNDTLAVTLDWGRGYVSEVMFNRAGQIVGVTHENTQGDLNFSSAAYTYDRSYDGQLLAANETLQQLLLSYDLVGRPLGSRAFDAAGLEKPRAAVTFTYDSMGNRVEEVRRDNGGAEVITAYWYHDTDKSLLRRRSVSSPPAGLAASAGLGLALLVLLARKRLKLGRHLLTLGVLLVFAGVVVRAQDSAMPPAYEYVYNPQGNLQAVIDLRAVADNDTVTFSYDAVGRLTQISPEIGSPQTFTYDAFGRLVTWNTTQGRSEYRYAGERLSQVIRDGDSALYLDGVVSLLAGNNSSWLLRDGTGAVRQRFDAGGVVITEYDVFGLPLTARDEGVFSPVYGGMLYSAEYGIYIGLDGRAYDPAAGRYLQRDRLGPDASGNLYAYGNRAAPPVQVRDPHLYTEGLDVLLQAQRQITRMTAASVLESHLPDLGPMWQDAGLAALSAYNRAISGPFSAFSSFPNWLAHTYNPPGVMVDGRRNFVLLDVNNIGWDELPRSSAQTTRISPFALPEINLRWSPLALKDKFQTQVVAARWYDPDLWRVNRVFKPNYTIPRPTAGFRSPGAINSWLPFPMADLRAYSDLFTGLDGLPVAEVEQWVEQVEHGVLPKSPDAPPSVETWLQRWFTSDTLPVWETLRKLSALPAVPKPAFDLGRVIP